MLPSVFSETRAGFHQALPHGEACGCRLRLCPASHPRMMSLRAQNSVFPVEGKQAGQFEHVRRNFALPLPRVLIDQHCSIPIHILSHIRIYIRRARRPDTFL